MVRSSRDLLCRRLSTEQQVRHRTKHRSKSIQLRCEKQTIDKIDDIGRTALHYACRNGHYEVGKFLLDNGAMPSTKTFTTGATPLHLAAKHGYGRICKLLLERGASKNERDIDGRTALDIAMQAEKQDSIDALQ